MNSLRMPKRWIKNTLRIYLLPNAVLMSLAILSLLALSGCSSAPSVQAEAPKPAPPAAWAMEEPQSLQALLDKIIYVSSGE